MTDTDAPPFVPDNGEINISFTIGGVRFTAGTLAELEAAAAASPTVFQKVKEIEQAQIAAGVFAAKSSKATPDVPVAPASGPGNVPSCKHGVMTDLRGKTYGPNSKNAGKPYPHAFYCPADFKAPDKCDARD